MSGQEGLSERVAKQDHYTASNCQPIEFCHRNGLDWCEGNVVKYVTRHKRKNGLEDLYKAAAYLKVLIYFVQYGEFLTPDKLEEKGFKI